MERQVARPAPRHVEPQGRREVIGGDLVGDGGREIEQPPARLAARVGRRERAVDGVGQRVGAAGRAEVLRELLPCSL
jgi:hypothetical protein